MKKPVISIVMGSQSDLPIMKETGLILKDFGIPFEILVLSAHRTPDETAAYAKKLNTRNIKVVIAGAGGSAALAGAVAAHTPLPVIGVPIDSVLNGMDSLLSTIQMPPGVPVAGVAIGKAGAKNAALLALRILGVSDAKVQVKLNNYKKAKAKKIKKIKVKI